MDLPPTLTAGRHHDRLALQSVELDAELEPKNSTPEVGLEGQVQGGEDLATLRAPRRAVAAEQRWNCSGGESAHQPRLGGARHH